MWVLFFFSSQFPFLGAIVDKVCLTLFLQQLLSLYWWDLFSEYTMCNGVKLFLKEYFIFILTIVRLAVCYLILKSTLCERSIVQTFWKTHVSFIPNFITFGDEVTKILCNLCLHFARQDGKKRKKITHLKWPKYQKPKDENMGWTKHKSIN